MFEILVASNNKHKIHEYQKMFQGFDVKIYSPNDLNIHVNPEENGTTYEENSLIKAKALQQFSNLPIIADDSGLMVDAMDGGPGVYSARFMGEDTGYDVKCGAILKNLEGLEDEKRGARFVCAMALAYPKETGKETKIFKGIFEGRIAYEPKGENGFGYDPIFFVPEKNQTSAEISPEEKNEMSHRGKALRLAVEELKTLM